MGFGCVVFLDAAPHHIISYQGSCSVACRLMHELVRMYGASRVLTFDTLLPQKKKNKQTTSYILVLHIFLFYKLIPS